MSLPMVITTFHPKTGFIPAYPDTFVLFSRAKKFTSNPAGRQYSVEFKKESEQGVDFSLIQRNNRLDRLAFSL